jgi:gliding motility-associated-like protein
MLNLKLICNVRRFFRVNTSMLTRVIVLALLLLSVTPLFSQDCTNLGQTPGTAFPVCGESVFEQKDVPICGIRPIKVPGCDDGDGYSDKNPYWYKFTCFTGGTLGFVITPLNLADDYDWMLYDITGKNPNDVFTDVSLVVTGSWSGSSGTTGASSTGVTFIQCSSAQNAGKPTFAVMPTLKVGHTYLLLVSHYTDSQSGYKLSFGGGTAVITDPKLPKLDKVLPGCGGVSLTVVLNKKMKCGTLAANASDFSISPALAPIISVSGNSCSNGFDMDTIVLTMGNALPFGNYTLTINKGSDANTLLDNCDRDIPAGDNLPFTITAILPTPLDSVKPAGCAPRTIDLVFDKRIKCSAIAADGSDFKITGPTAVTITGAQGVACSNDLSPVIRLQLSAPIETAGTYTIQLLSGLDGNTIVDECGQQTPPSSINFTTKDTVNALFNYQVQLTCTLDTVVVSHPGSNGVNEWSWSFNGEGGSDQQSLAFEFPTFGTKLIRLAVTNGVCTDTAYATVNLDNELRAGFMLPDVLCPEDAAVFKDTSFGKIQTWSWDFGNGTTGAGQVPVPQRYKRPTGRTGFYMVRLIVENDLHCFDTMIHKMNIVYSCYITVPNAFTPNGDGNNDFLYPLNAYKAAKLEFQVYNRYGQQVFFTSNWQRKWDGTFNGIQQPSGAYVWRLAYTDTDTQKHVFLKGVTTLIR